MGKWGTFPAPVHVPLNKPACKNMVEENQRTEESEHPHPGPTGSSVHNYNTEMSRRRTRRAWAPTRKWGETGRTEEGKRNPAPLHG